EEALAAVRTLALGLLAQTSGDLADEAVERLLGRAFEHDHRKARELAREARGMRDELAAGGSAVVRALAAAVATSWVHLMVLEPRAATPFHGEYDARSAAGEQRAVRGANRRFCRSARELAILKAAERRVVALSG